METTPKPNSKYQALGSSSTGDLTGSVSVDLTSPSLRSKERSTSASNGSVDNNNNASPGLSASGAIGATSNYLSNMYGYYYGGANQQKERNGLTIATTLADYTILTKNR